MRTLILLLIFFCYATLHAQWQSDVRLTNDPSLSTVSYNNGRNIAAEGSNIYAVWYDSRDQTDEIYFKRSTDGGNNWLSDTRLTTDSLISYYASIAVSGSNVHIAWQNLHSFNK